jgi:hypothetical protein
MKQKRQQLSVAIAWALIAWVLTTASPPVCAQTAPQPAPQPASQPGPQSTPQTGPQAKPGFEPSWLSLANISNLHLGSWSGSLGFDYLYGEQSSNSAGSGVDTSSNTGLREAFRIANQGFYFLSPLLCNGNMVLTLDFDQDKSVAAGTSTGQNGRDVGYGLGLNFLSEMPYTGEIFANRTQTQILQPFGGLMVGVDQNSAIMFQLLPDSIFNDLGFPWLGATLGIHQDHNQNTTTSFGNSMLTDEKNSSLDFSLQKGFETADLGFNFQANDQENQIISEDNFRSKAAGLSYSLDFGPSLNRRFDANVNYMERGGVSPSTMLIDTEHVHIDHFQNLKTDYQYGFNRQTTDGVSNTTQNGTFNASYQLFPNLGAMAGLNVTDSSLVGGSTESYGGTFSQNYHHGLPGSGNLSLNWGAGYQLTNDNLSSSIINVLNEAHSAPNPFGAGAGFLLSNNFAVASSVVVTDVRGGELIPVVAGVDYDLIDQNNQIKIVPLAGSLLIQPGDPLTVSYDYQADANGRSAAKSSGFGVMLDYHWISISFNRQVDTQIPLGGSSADFLESSQDNNLLLGLHGLLLGMTASADMGLENYKSTSSAYQQDKLAGTLEWLAQRGLQVTFSANASQNKYTFPDEHKISLYDARSSVVWYTSSGWSNTGTVGWSTSRDSAASPQTLLQATAQSKIILGKLSLSASAAFGYALENGSRSTNRSFNLSTVRQF